MGEQVVDAISTGAVVAGGDKEDKAMTAVFDIVTAQGVGEGREGGEVLAAWEGYDPPCQCGQGFEVFGYMAGHVNVDE